MNSIGPLPHIYDIHTYNTPRTTNKTPGSKPPLLPRPIDGKKNENTTTKLEILKNEF
jgi:hypothetical protein